MRTHRAGLFSILTLLAGMMANAVGSAAESNAPAGTHLHDLAAIKGCIEFAYKERMFRGERLVVRVADEFVGELRASFTSGCLAILGEADRRADGQRVYSITVVYREFAAEKGQIQVRYGSGPSDEIIFQANLEKEVDEVWRVVSVIVLAMV